jgi:tRNA modification GTPase
MNVAALQNVASVLTPPGRGAIAVVTTAGPGAHAAVDAHFRAANGRLIARQRVGRIVFGHWGEMPHSEEVVVCRQSAEALEIHCHGGAAAVARIVEALAAAGCRIASWKEWLATSAPDVLTAEADLALTEATTDRTAAILLDQRAGTLRAAVEELVRLLEVGEPAAAIDGLAALLGRATLGSHLMRPWQVAIAGRPNVGKSSLANALLGYQRAIVFDQPGTTRDVLAAETAVDGWPVRLTDAAGIRVDAGDSIEAEGVCRARRRVAEADLVIWVLDAAALPPSELSDAMATAWKQLAVDLDAAFVRSVDPLVVLNKFDLLSPSLVEVAMRQAPSAIAVSALKRTGLDLLLGAIGGRLVPHPPQPGDAVPFTERQRGLLEQAQSCAVAGDVGGAAGWLRRFIDGR